MLFLANTWGYNYTSDRSRRFIERIGQHLPGWKGRLLNRVGCLALISSVLSTMPTYHPTAFPLEAWTRKNRQDHDNIPLERGGKCKRRTLPSYLANGHSTKGSWGLRVSILDRFGHALKLRCLWQDWTEDSKPWAGMDLPCNNADHLLLNSSTTITLGDGAKHRFWHNN